MNLMPNASLVLTPFLLRPEQCSMVAVPLIAICFQVVDKLLELTYLVHVNVGSIGY